MSKRKLAYLKKVKKVKMNFHKGDGIIKTQNSPLDRLTLGFVETGET